MIPTRTGEYTDRGTPILSDGTLDYTFGRRIELNRSKRWNRAETYQEARDKSPSNEPVR
jgi:hypothetical protein